MGSTPVSAPAGHVRPVTMPLVDRIASAVVTAVPPIMLVIGMWFGWVGNLLNWQDILILAVFYMGVGTGITVGFHRLLTHGSFKCHRLTRAVFAALGSAAAEGPVIDWVATHRKHHQFSDADGDPHSPHVGHGSGWRGALSGLVHAHLGWVFSDMEVADERTLRQGPARRPVDPVRRPARSCSGCCSVSPPRSASASPSPGTVTGGSDGPAVGWRGPDLLHAPRDLQHQLAVSLLRPAGLRHAGRVTQPRLAGHPDLGRGVAQQPPRVPDARIATACGAGRSTRRPRSSA